MKASSSNVFDRKLLLQLAFAAASFVVASAHVSARAVRCDGCTEPQMRAKAMALTQRATPPYTDVIYVADFMSGFVEKFNVSKTYDNGGDPRICSQPAPSVPLECVTFISVVKQPVEALVTAYVQKAKNYSFSHTPVIFVDPLAPQMPGNAYDAVQHPVLSENVGTYIKNGGYGFVQDILNAASVFDVIPGFKADAVKITLRVNYPDGGTSLYAYNNETKTWERVKGQTRDRSGNTVPETAEDVAGGGVGTTVEYSFPGDDESLAEFIIRMEMLGIPITGPMSDRLRCSSKVEGGRVVVSCQFY